MSLSDRSSLPTRSAELARALLLALGPLATLALSCEDTAGTGAVNAHFLRDQCEAGFNQPFSGTVSVFKTAELTGDSVATAHAGKRGSFTIKLTPGTYYLTAKALGGGSQCWGTKPAVVATGTTVHVDVTCDAD